MLGQRGSLSPTGGPSGEPSPMVRRPSWPEGLGEDVPDLEEGPTRTVSTGDAGSSDDELGLEWDGWLLGGPAHPLFDLGSVDLGLGIPVERGEQAAPAITVERAGHLDVDGGGHAALCTPFQQGGRATSPPGGEHAARGGESRETASEEERPQRRSTRRRREHWPSPTEGLRRSSRTSRHPYGRYAETE